MYDFSGQILRAAELGNIVTLRTLLPKVQSDVSDPGGNTCLMYAAKEGHVSVVRLLLKHGADPDRRNSYGWTPTMQASSSGHVRCVKCLLEFGADVMLRNQFKQTALVQAAAKGHNDIVQSLVTAMSHLRNDDDEVKHQLSEALSYAAYHANVSTVKLLLHFNADISRTVRETGWTALLYGLLAGSLPTCKTLLYAATPALSATTSLTATPALDNRYSALLLEVIRSTESKEKAELMALLADTLRVPDSSKSISVAIENGDLEALQRVIGLADAQSNKLMGGTPLMFASVMGQTEIVKWLLEVGCDINAQDENNKWTALMQAVFHGHYRIVEYLLSAGADPEIGNDDGLNAHSIATMLNDEHLSEMLVKYCRVPGNSSGKKWWGKLTNKFSTIRALTAFKGKLKEIQQEAKSAASAKEDDVDPNNLEDCASKTTADQKNDNTSENGNTSPEPTSSPATAGDHNDEDHDDDEVMEISSHERSHDTKMPLNLTHSHVIEVQPRISEEDVVENSGGELDIPVLEDVVAEDLESEDNDNDGPDEDAAPATIEEEELISPDSGFVSRGANSIPLDSQIIQSEYDGLDVDVPELPAELCPLEPDYEEWYPHNPQLSEQMVRAMGAPEDIIRELKQLNFLVDS